MAKEKEVSNSKLLRAIEAVHARVDTNMVMTGQMQDSITSMEGDIKTIKADLAELSETAFTKMEQEDLLARVKFIEKRLAIKSGK